MPLAQKLMEWLNPVVRGGIESEEGPERFGPPRPIVSAGDRLDRRWKFGNLLTIITDWIRNYGQDG
jgi:hypothetical protein